MVATEVTLLIDSDIVAYKFASVNQDDYDWGDGVSSRVTNLDNACHSAWEYVEGLLDTLRATDAIVCLTDSSNWRMDVLPTYKENRKGLEKPELLIPVKEYLADKYQSYTRPTLEADDVMGILSTHKKLVEGKKIIVSEDKDMQTIPGWLFNPRKDKKPRRITEMQADRFHLYQTLIGDTTDGYKGCPGIGDKRATALLDSTEPEDWWPAIVAEFEKKGLTEDDALVQARVARICRADDYDFKNKEVKLWQPQRMY